jgi:hypothetical protein
MWFRRGSQSDSYRVTKVASVDLLRSTEALGDVVAGQLDVNAALPKAGSTVDKAPG